MDDLPEQLLVALSADISKLDKQLQKALGNVGDFARKQEGMYKESFDKVERMAAQLDIQNKLSVASAGGDSAAVRSLQEQLELSRQIQRFRISGMDQGAAEAAAKSHLAAVAAAQASAAVAQRAAAMEQIALEEKLEVARARGERREVEALEEELALSRAIAKYKAAGFSEAQSKEMAGNQMAALNGAKRGSVGKALDKTLEDSRVGVLEEGAARIPIFGSALEALGPAGIAAAAGVFAAAEAMEHVKEASEYAEELSITAGKLGVTTKALQEYQYVALMSGVSTDSLREALQKGDEVLGAFQSGVGAARIKPVFEALGISQQEAQKASSITALLPEIADKIKAVGSVAEQTKLAEKLGLSELLPVLQKGRAGVEELRAEAVKSGVVLDTELVQRGKDAAEEYKKAAAIIDGNMKRAFIELAPLIEKCLGLAAELAKQFADAMDSFHGIESQNRVHVEDEKTNTERGQKVWAALGGGTVDKNGNMQGGAAFQTMMFNRGKDRLSKLDSRLKELDAQDAKANADIQHPPARTLVNDKTRTKKAPENKTDDLDNSSKEAADAAAKDLASAQAELAKGFLEHAQFEKAAVDADTDKKLEDLAKQEETVRKAKVDAHRAQQLAALETAKVDAQIAAIDKKEAIDRKALEAQQAFRREMDDQIADAMASHLSNEAAIADSSGERRQLELQALALRQDQAKRDFEADAAKKLREHPDDPDLAAKINQQRDTFDQGQADARSNIIRSTDSPGRAFDRQLNQQQGDLSDQLETVEVSGVEKLGDALDEVITRTKTAKEAFRDMAMSIVGDLLKIDIQRNLEKPLADALFGKPAVSAQVGPISSGLGALSLGSPSGSLDTALTNTGMDPTGTSDSNLVGKGISFMGSLTKLLGIPGFAEGTDDAPGGETLVGEHGPELVKLPGGSQVMTNDAVRNLPTAGPGSAPQAVTMNHHIKIDLTGANGDATIQQIAFQAAAAGSAHAIATGQKAMQRAARSQKQSLVGR